MFMSAVMESVAAHPAQCANCDKPLEDKFCSACGQRAHLHKSLLHLAEEIVHGLLHFDAKGIRTLPMLVAYPGELTRRYIDGQRTRFVSPLGLFLFMVFFLFFVGSLTTTSVKDIDTDPKARLERNLAKAKAKVERAEAALEAERAQGKDVSEEQVTLDFARQALDRVGDEEAAAAEAVTTASKGQLTGQGSKIAIEETLRHAAANKELTAYKIKNAGAKFSFLLVPISLPFIWLLFCRRRDLTMYDHAVFSLYSLSFMSLLCSVLFVTNYWDLDYITGWLLALAPPIHMYRQLRGTYALGRWSAVWRTWALMFSAGMVLACYLVLILMLTFA